jgi:hypothetical protein
MLAAIIVTVIVPAVLGAALLSGKRDPLIGRRPYNNQYGDAPGARDDSFSSLL